jgi:hypothetical protein
VLLFTAVLLAGYLVAVRRRAAAGLGWPVVRIFCAVAAAALTVFVLDSGVAGYANAVWSVTVTQQAVTSMLIPLAIASARPWELFESPATSRLLGRLTAHPGSVLVLSLGWSAAALLTPVALWSVSSHAVLVATRLGDIAVGTALFAALSVPAGAAQSSRRTAGRLGWLAGWFAGQAAITGLLLSGGAAAREWFSLLNIAWITVSQDEQTAALIRFGVAVAVFAVTIVVTAAQPPASKTAPTSSAPKTRSEFGEFGPSTPTISPEYPHVQ